MIDLQDIRPLTDFARNTKAFVKQMKKTKRPTILTVNGRAELVVQDAQSYQQLLEMAAYTEERVKFEKSLEDIEDGRLHDEAAAMAVLGIKATASSKKRLV